MTEKTKIEKLHQDLHDWMEAPTLESSTTIAHQLVRDNYTTLRELVGNAMQTLKSVVDVNDTNVVDIPNDKSVALEAEEVVLMNNLYDLARRTLWIAWNWNDHNFGPAHNYAREEAIQQGIKSFEEANDFLDKLEPIYRRALTTPPVDGATEEARYAREKLKQNIEYAEALDHYYVVLDIDFAKRLLLHTLDSAAKEK